MSRRYIIGIDEVGRGPLAGPVTVAALALPRNFKFKILNSKLPLRDSKKLSEKQREEWLAYIKSEPKILCAVASVYPKTIDRINITQAANRAATRATARLLTQNKELRTKNSKPRILLDGGLYLNQFLVLGSQFTVRSKTIVRGDEKFTPIKLASIVAKVKRDRLLKRYHAKFPEYKLEKHKGYGTKVHMAAIRKYGPSEIHRLTFLKKFITIDSK